MQIEARRNRVRLVLASTELSAHSVLTDHRAAVQAAVEQGAAWFEAEVERLLQGDTSDPLEAFQPQGAAAARPGNVESVSPCAGAPLIDIIINGKPVEVDVTPGSYLSYREIVRLAGETGEPSVVFGYPDGRKATLRPGLFATLMPGVAFSVIHAGRA